MISVFAIPSIVQVAHHKKLLNEPNGRTIHALLTPRLGGLAIFSGFISALAVFGQMTNGVQYVIAGCILLFFIGLKDDIVPVSAFKKFFVQVLATGIVIFMADIRITNFQGLLGIGDLEPGVSYAFSFMVIIGITNAFNLIDGLDGLAGTIIIVVSTFFAFFFFLFGGEKYSMYTIVAVSLIGGTLGFLRYNFHKAIIFMGDAGSLVCGFISAVLAIQFVEMRSVASSPVLAIGILYIPLLDTMRVFLIRILNGVSPFTPDKNHIHHCLIDMGLSQLATVALLVFVNLIIIAFVIYSVHWGVNVQLGILVFFSTLISISLKWMVGYKKIQVDAGNH
jgi:UDP-N-acetylmuramyl pentapeptide phosphotransferase/UDP-N-acetylglucosamine-1-phosphate transferase